MMMETSNTYQDCMHMPIPVFLNTIKNIRISQLMQNKEWREAYLNKLAEERVLKNKGISKTKMDMAGLKSFAQKL
ncbi:hypothetical protein [uncultured Oscillibacter sp.]|uniref:hypothetical protein n=1 Tax=uncultured Oscillibacter sp. TaxID=876091 RepID=UPI0025FDAC09|nr:hypothetical protein [uncultured Oscillibacter sp.]